MSSLSAREIMLERIRAATSDVPASEPAAWGPELDSDPAAAYVRHGSLGATERTELFVERCADYAATVTRCGDTAAAVSGTIAEIAAGHSAATLAVPADLNPGWLAPGVALLADDPLGAPLSLDALNGVDGVLTGSALAIAETGSIVLAAGPGQGRRALTLVPDLHICVVRAADIVVSVPEAIIALGGALAERAPVTFISGPSATSDIELNRVEGVHGPRQLEVIVAG